MKTPLDELNERFAVLVQETDREKFFRAVCEYLLYISDTSPLNGIAREMLSGGMERLYKALQKAGAEAGSPTDKIWGDVVRQNVGKQSAYGVPASFWDTDTLRSFVRVLHSKMQTATRKALAGRREVIIIKKKDAMVYLEENKTKCYTIKSRGANAQPVPQRLRILLMLARQRDAISAENLTGKLGGKDITTTRKAIRQINKQFRDRVFDAADIIVYNEWDGKYVYSLNRDAFEFKIK